MRQADPQTPGVLLNQVVHTYDVYDRRIATTSTVRLADGQTVSYPTTHQYYVFDGENLALIYRADGAGTPILAERLYYAGTDQLLMVDQTGRGHLLWVLTDEQDSPLGFYGKLPDSNDCTLHERREYLPDGTWESTLLMSADASPNVDVGF